MSIISRFSLVMASLFILSSALAGVGREGIGNANAEGISGVVVAGGGGGGTVGSLFLVDGTDPVFLVNGTSGVCLTGGGC
jgi:hypothetical protein